MTVDEDRREAAVSDQPPGTWTGRCGLPRIGLLGLECAAEIVWVMVPTKSWLWFTTGRARHPLSKASSWAFRMVAVSATVSTPADGRFLSRPTALRCSRQDPG